MVRVTGRSTARLIVTDRPQAVTRNVFDGLGIGVTAWPAKGMYTAAEHTVLFCTVSRPEVDALRAAVSEADGEAFIVIGHGHQASGGVFRQSLRRAGAIAAVQSEIEEQRIDAG